VIEMRPTPSVTPLVPLHPAVVDIEPTSRRNATCSICPRDQNRLRAL
jgi:hypothetical protein